MTKKANLSGNHTCPNCHSSDTGIAATPANYVRLAIVGIAAWTIFFPPCQVVYVCGKCSKTFFRWM